MINKYFSLYKNKQLMAYKLFSTIFKHPTATFKFVIEATNLNPLKENYLKSISNMIISEVKDNFEVTDMSENLIESYSSNNPEFPISVSQQILMGITGNDLYKTLDFAERFQEFINEKYSSRGMSFQAIYTVESMEISNMGDDFPKLTTP
ncbi:hypothetical protein SZ25_00533 [Candidatus Arcanobacter lacustris]|uniref:Uncharacterized protein n=1 Tax=Candidatus Arcanibacter lacustris TaxID=1607817 RepID=A0A0F5MNI6_9RICK|nr:hypothetical protein SZ25_00533 [Candidatus Arcanobacter lacustris]